MKEAKLILTKVVLIGGVIMKTKPKNDFELLVCALVDFAIEIAPKCKVKEFNKALEKVKKKIKRLKVFKEV